MEAGVPKCTVDLTAHLLNSSTVSIILFKSDLLNIASTLFRSVWKSEIELRSLFRLFYLSQSS